MMHNSKRFFSYTTLFIYGSIACLLVSSCTLPQLGYPPTSPITLDLKIMGQGTASKDMLCVFLRSNNPALKPSYVENIVTIYLQETQAEGVNTDIAFCQMCHETNFLKYGNQVKSAQNNFAGIGATDDGTFGARFSTPRIGIRAHIQHLKAYASTAKLNNPVVDPRFSYVKRGCAPILRMLVGRWATDPAYVKKIEAKLQKLYSLAPRSNLY